MVMSKNVRGLAIVHKRLTEVFSKIMAADSRSTRSIERAAEEGVTCLVWVYVARLYIHTLVNYYTEYEILRNWYRSEYTLNYTKIYYDPVSILNRNVAWYEFNP